MATQLPLHIRHRRMLHFLPSYLPIGKNYGIIQLKDKLEFVEGSDCDEKHIFFNHQTNQMNRRKYEYNHLFLINREKF